MARFTIEVDLDVDPERVQMALSDAGYTSLGDFLQEPIQREVWDLMDEFHAWGEEED